MISCDVDGIYFIQKGLVLIESPLTLIPMILVHSYRERRSVVSTLTVLLLCASLTDSLSALAWMCLRGDPSWAPGGTELRPPLVKSCLMMPTMLSWGPRRVWRWWTLARCSCSSPRSSSYSCEEEFPSHSWLYRESTLPVSAHVDWAIHSMHSKPPVCKISTVYE